MNLKYTINDLLDQICKSTGINKDALVGKLSKHLEKSTSTTYRYLRLEKTDTADIAGYTLVKIRRFLQQKEYKEILGSLIIDDLYNEKKKARKRAATAAKN